MECGKLLYDKKHEQGDAGMTHLLKAIAYSMAGLRAAIRNEPAFLQELLVLCVAIPVGIHYGDSGVERALLVGSVLLVPVVELINSAIESTVDRISEERHELSGRAKDMGSAAVLLTIINAVVIWLLILTG